MTDATYNGWSNYETWAVHLWLSSEEPSYRFWGERAESWHQEPSTSDYWTQEESAKINLAEELKDAHEEGAEFFAADTASVYADLLTSALQDVDWYEIAEALLADVAEEVAS